MGNKKLFYILYLFQNEMSRSSCVQYNNTCFLEIWIEALNANWEANFVALAATTKVSQVPYSMLS